MDALARLMDAVDAALLCAPRVLVGVDGMCAAGKTTLARALCERVAGNCLSMDDFFLPAARRTAERMAMPGGHIDLERFAAEVLAPLSAGQAFAYQPFDCSRQALGARRPVAPARVTVVEGAYCLHPALRARYDVTAFVTVRPEVQRARLLMRNGEAGLARFLEEWIPREARYAEAYGIPARAGIHIDTSDSF